MARGLHGSRIDAAATIEPNEPLPLPEETFDLVVSMDVIEHVPDPRPWVRDIVRMMRPGGRLFLTTPNYGFSTLGLIENTALELVARAQGFSRKDLHPSKFSRRKLASELLAAGLIDVKVERIAFGWVLAATATKPNKSS
jgi:2-polyprenyl-3-methyl-5-hydroxy-6-metoxy-1,4-benzoquinol methylase